MATVRLAMVLCVMVLCVVDCVSDSAATACVLLCADGTVEVPWYAHWTVIAPCDSSRPQAFLACFNPLHLSHFVAVAAAAVVAVVVVM